MDTHARMFKYKGKQVRVTAIRDLTEQKKAAKEIQTLRGILLIWDSVRVGGQYKVVNLEAS